MSARQEEAPAKEIAAAARDVVERVLLGAAGLPGQADVAAILAALDAVGKALGALETSHLDEADHLERFDRVLATLRAAEQLLDLAAAPPPEDAEDVARALLERAGATLPPRPPRRAASSASKLLRTLAGVKTSIGEAKARSVDAVVADHDRPLRAPPPPRAETPPVPPFRASIGVPSLHHVAGPIGPFVPRILDEDEQDDVALASPERRERALLGVSGEVAQLRRLARDCMEDVALLGHLRTLPAGMRWSSALDGFDQRLLDNVDALLSLARLPAGAPDALRSVRVLDDMQRWVANAPVADPARSFAQALVLGSVDGEDAARAAVVGLCTSHPSTLAAQRDALVLASSPRLGPALRRLLTVGDTPRIVVALEVLRFRGEADYAGVVLLLGHPDVLVREATARCLADLEPREASVSALHEALSMEEDERVALALSTSLVLAGETAGLTHAREAIAAELESRGDMAPEVRLGFLRLLGVSGVAADAELLGQSLDHHADEALALGWHGHPDHVATLLAALDADEKRGAPSLFRAAVCEALRRITGGPVLEPDDLEDDDADGLAHTTFAASTFRAFWETKRGELAKPQRYRFGVPYTTSLTLDELERDGVRIETREDLALEAALGTGTAPLFVRDWNARQRVELTRLRGRVGQGSAGEWPGAHLARRR